MRGALFARHYGRKDGTPQARHERRVRVSMLVCVQLSAASVSSICSLFRFACAATACRCFRHPSYVGWFYWSVGTQLLLCNPLCTVLYGLAAWAFFKDRIPYEEALLL